MVKNLKLSIAKLPSHLFKGWPIKKYGHPLVYPLHIYALLIQKKPVFAPLSTSYRRETVKTFDRCLKGKKWRNTTKVSFG